jgi:hypothetical protein
MKYVKRLAIRGIFQHCVAADTCGAHELSLILIENLFEYFYVPVDTIGPARDGLSTHLTVHKILTTLTLYHHH